MCFDFSQLVREFPDPLLTGYQKHSWQALAPNLATSDTIEEKLFFGRTIYVPLHGYERAFVISGCTSKSNTQTVSTQVQEWNLQDMTVKLREPLTIGRTSFACTH